MHQHNLFDLQNKLLHKNIEERIKILSQVESVQFFLKNKIELATFLARLPPLQKAATYAVIAIDQAIPLFKIPITSPKWPKLLADLEAIEKFYHDFGGIVGYQSFFMKTLAQKQLPQKAKSLNYSNPKPIDLRQNTEQYVQDGLKILEQLAEIYPAGGAGDRLSLIDPQSQEPAPAACLPFCGKTLLEGLFRDLEAREQLYFSKFGKKLQTPVAIMCSPEKNNRTYIQNLLEKHSFFGRKRELIRLFEQCQVPVVDKEGRWCIKDLGEIHLKPGGHGVLWKAARDQGIFDWLRAQGRSKMLVRQINNPMAGIDHTLLSFTGACKNYDFAFLSCPRPVGASEGMLVIKEWEENNKKLQSLCNVEYTSFKENGIQDQAQGPRNPFSIYPSNTNILFADLASIEKLSKNDPLPGALVNIKTSFLCLNEDGSLEKREGGRLESSMQNIADQIIIQPSQDHKEDMRSCVAFNDRKKTLAVTKRLYQKGKGLADTPEGALETLLLNYYELLSKHCKIKVPLLWENFEKQGPTFFCLLYPSLGPLFSAISEKISKGEFEAGFELQIDLAKAQIKNLHLKGSLIIETKRADENTEIPTELEARCNLENISIENQGIDWNANNLFWKNEIHRKEKVLITLFGNAEFCAKDIYLKGNHQFLVPNGKRLTLEKNGEQIEEKWDSIETRILKNPGEIFVKK